MSTKKCCSYTENQYERETEQSTINWKEREEKEHSINQSIHPDAGLIGGVVADAAAATVAAGAVRPCRGVAETERLFDSWAVQCWNLGELCHVTVFRTVQFSVCLWYLPGPNTTGSCVCLDCEFWCASPFRGVESESLGG